MNKAGTKNNCKKEMLRNLNRLKLLKLKRPKKFHSAICTCHVRITFKNKITDDRNGGLWWIICRGFPGLLSSKK